MRFGFIELPSHDWIESYPIGLEDKASQSVNKQASPHSG
jgi:hypothetical protein